MSKRLDLVDQRFERLLVIADIGTKHRKSLFLCRCDCCNEIIVFGSDLKSGNTKSCGCLQRERVSEATSGENHYFYGKHHTEETKRKNSEWHKKWQKGVFAGKNNPNYIDGRTPKNKRIRGSSEMEEWRHQIFERDDYTCQICSRKGKIAAHHIWPFSMYNFIRFELWNGITLCKNPCHQLIRGKELEYAKGFFDKVIDYKKIMWKFGN